MKKTKKTDRGFKYIEFHDINGIRCNIQKSSMAIENGIWVGAEEIGLKHFKAGQGWKDVKLKQDTDDHYVANNRMHLTQWQVQELLPVLVYFAEFGELPELGKDIIVGCQAGKDGECYHPLCPQKRDNEPETSGRSCPIAIDYPDEL